MADSAKYTQVKVSVDPAIAIAFKAACAATDVSMAAVLAEFMADYSKSPLMLKVTPDYSTRRRRRAAIKGLVDALQTMKAWEERVLGNMPENLQGSSVSDAAEEALSSLEEAIDALASFWMVP